MLLAAISLMSAAPLIEEQPELFELKDEQVILLGRLYQRDPFTKAAVRGIAVETLGGRGMFIDRAGHLFLFAAKFMGVGDATAALCSEGSNGAIAHALSAVRQLLRFDHPSVPDECLDGLRTLKQRVPAREYTWRPQFAEDLEVVPKAVERIKYVRLKSDLQGGANLQINEDKEELTKGLSFHGFSPGLSNLLEAAETEYRKRGTDFSFKKCAGLNRDFLENLLGELAAKAALLCTPPQRPPEASAKAVDVRLFLERSGFYSRKLGKLVEGLYGFISEEGTHQPECGSDVARIARNMNIEVGLLLIRRLNGLAV